MKPDHNFIIRFRDELTCPLCHRLFDNPCVFSGCNHAFCYACVVHTLEGPGITSSQCPTCKQPGWKNELLPVHTIQSLVDILRNMLNQTGLPHHAPKAQKNSAAKGCRGAGSSGSKSGSKAAVGSSRRQTRSAAQKQPEAGSRSAEAGLGDRKRKAGRAEQPQGLDISPPLGGAFASPAELGNLQKQVRFADEPAEPQHAPEKESSLSPVAGGKQVTGQQAELANDLAPDMENDGWDVPNTFPLDPHGYELLPNQPPPASTTRPPARLRTPLSLQQETPPAQEEIAGPRKLSEKLPGKLQDAALKLCALDDHLKAPAGSAGGGSSAGASSAKTGGQGSEQCQLMAGRAKKAKRARAAPDVAPAVTRSSKRLQPSVGAANAADKAQLPARGKAETLAPGETCVAAAAQDDDFQEAPPSNQLDGCGFGRGMGAAQAKQPGRAGKGGQRVAAGKAAAAHKRGRGTAERRTMVLGERGNEKGTADRKPQRKGRRLMKEVAAGAKMGDKDFAKLFTAEAVLPPSTADISPENDAPVVNSPAAEQPQQPSSLEEVPGTASDGEPAAAAAAAAGNALVQDLLRHDPDGPLSTATPSGASERPSPSKNDVSGQQQQQCEQRGAQGLEHSRQKQEDADSLTVPDTPHADMAPAQRCHLSMRSPLHVPGMTPLSEERSAAARTHLRNGPAKLQISEPAEADNSREALSVVDINALGARLVEQVASPKCAAEAEAMQRSEVDMQRAIDTAKRMCLERALPPPIAPTAPTGGTDGGAGVVEPMGDPPLNGGLAAEATLGMSTLGLGGTQRSLAEIDEAMLARGYRFSTLDAALPV